MAAARDSNCCSPPDKEAVERSINGSKWKNAAHSPTRRATAAPSSPAYSGENASSRCTLSVTKLSCGF